jgi:hypothetical protein
MYRCTLNLKLRCILKYEENRSFRVIIPNKYKNTYFKMLSLRTHVCCMRMTFFCGWKKWLVQSSGTVILR